MENGLYDMTIVSFVFTPMVMTITLLFFIWWRQTRDRRSAMATIATMARMAKMDGPGRLLASAVQRMPEERRDWGAAMLAELGQLQRSSSRWWFALSCVRVALFPPRRNGLHLMPSLNRQDSICGILAVALPPLGLPLIYLAAVIVEAIGGSPLTQSSRWSNPAAMIELTRIIVLLTIFCILAGLPLGVAGLVRRERQRWLSVMGMFSSLCIISYFMTVMHFFAGGPNGD